MFEIRANVSFVSEERIATTIVIILILSTMRNSVFWWVLIGFMVLLDFYFFQALKTITQTASSKARLIIFISYWVISISAIVLLLLLPYLNFESKILKNTLFAMIAGLFFAKLVASSIFVVDDIRRGVQWLAGKVFFSNTEGEGYQAGEKISRSLFLSWTGMLVGGGLFGSLIYGFGNKYRYQLRRMQLAFEKLPASFKGLKIVHISDIHSGSFTDKHAVKKGVEKILNEKPDLILFTGDLVNNRSNEMDDYIDIFKEVKAPMGVYSILGNHDYGDYTKWDSEVTKKYADIDLMLSGHTHGFQFGIEIPGFKWSPVQYVYKQWAGHYREGNQQLYINRGFGFLAYPGRVGILPEITVIELI